MELDRASMSIIELMLASLRWAGHLILMEVNRAASWVSQARQAEVTPRLRHPKDGLNALQNHLWDGGEGHHLRKRREVQQPNNARGAGSGSPVTPTMGGVEGRPDNTSMQANHQAIERAS